MKQTRQPKARRRASGQPPASGQRPNKVRSEDSKNAFNELISFHQLFEPFFHRREQAVWSWFYLCAQLSDLERKTIEPMVLSWLDVNSHAVRDLQRFMSESPWESRPAMIHL